MVQVGDRRTCGYGTVSGGPCSIEIELRQGPNLALPPGWFEVASGAPHSCRWLCPSCQQRVGGPDRHALGCEVYSRLRARQAEVRSRRSRT